MKRLMMIAGILSLTVGFTIIVLNVVGVFQSSYGIVIGVVVTSTGLGSLVLVRLSRAKEREADQLDSD